MKHIIIAEDFQRELANTVNELKVCADEGQLDDMSTYELIDLFHRNVINLVTYLAR